MARSREVALFLGVCCQASPVIFGPVFRDILCVAFFALPCLWEGDWGFRSSHPQDKRWSAILKLVYRYLGISNQTSLNASSPAVSRCHQGHDSPIKTPNPYTIEGSSPNVLYSDYPDLSVLVSSATVSGSSRSN